MGIALSVIPMLIHILALNYLWMEKSYKLWNVKIISYIMRKSDGDKKKTLQIIR